MRNFRMAALLAALIATPAAAEDLALLVMNRAYDDQRDARDVGDGGDLSARLEAAGFEVEVLQNLRTGDLQARVGRLRRDIEAADRLVVVLAGHVVSTGRETWLLARDADRPDSLSAGAEGLPLGPILDLAGQKPGAALIALAASERALRVGPGLEAGYLPGDLPQGVSVVAGPAQDLLEFLGEEVLVPGRALGRAMEDAPETVAAFGFLPAAVPFLPSAEGGPDRADLALWAEVSAEDSIDGYETYLRRYPGGVRAADAERRLEELRASPEAQAEAAEAALALSADQRREIQRNLSILGFDTRGIDGIFGRGTRAAIRSWQAREGLDRTGYVTGNQVTQLQIQAERRARELEEEAERRKAEQDRQDEAYWRETGRADTEAGARAYLERYPDGLYADIAQERLDGYEEENRARAEEAERDFWEAAREADTPEAYRNYLENYPDGAFAGEARDRMEGFEGERSDLAALEAEEADVLANPITRLLVERRLQQLGFDPGQADGNFDDQTRRAIRRYQRSRDLEVTGYVTRSTMVRILAGGG